MNFLGRLLDGVAVEWKPLGEILMHKGYIRGPFGSAIKKEFFVAEGVPVYEQQHAIYDKRDFRYFIAKDRAESLKRFTVKPNDIIISCSGTIGRISIINQQDRVGVINQALLILRLDLSQVNIKFIKYYLECFPNLIVSSTGGAITNIEKREVIEKIQIPIPCPDNPDRSLAIQAEIVRILDTFTALTAELTAELTLRQTQYEYYRDRLLTFKKGEAEWKTLGEVALVFGRGKSKHRPRNDPKLYGGNTPFIQTGDIRNASHIIETYSQTYSEIGLKQSKLWPRGTLCITIAANIAETSILGFDACFPDSVIGFVADPEKTTSGYVEYLLSSLKTKLEEMGQGSAQSNINVGTFENLKLPFPPLEEQARIVAILDKFDTLTTSISEGLPREIALRQQQYEYYRNLLLTFPKPEA